MLKTIYFTLLAEAVEFTDHLCGGVRPLPNKCPGYDIKQSDGEAPVMMELWVMQSTPLLPLLPGPLWLGLVAPDRALFMGQKNYLTFKLCTEKITYAKPNLISM